MVFPLFQKRDFQTNFDTCQESRTPLVASLLLVVRVWRRVNDFLSLFWKSDIWTA